MNIGIIVLVVLFVGLLAYMIWYTGAASSNEMVLVEDSIAGATSTTLPVIIPQSYNQPEGIVYSYSMWVLIKDFTTGYGLRRLIFGKSDAPAIYIDSTSNSLIVAVKTYEMVETILIPNIPAMKWLHIAVVVNQQAVDVYINGTLRQHHTLSQLPDQNTDSFSIGPSWNGVVGKIKYFPKSLSYGEVRTLSQEKPPSDQRPKISESDYFDLSWYIGRLNSTA